MTRKKLRTKSRSSTPVLPCVILERTSRDVASHGVWWLYKPCHGMAKNQSNPHGPVEKETGKVCVRSKRNMTAKTTVLNIHPDVDEKE